MSLLTFTSFYLGPMSLQPRRVHTWGVAPDPGGQTFTWLFDIHLPTVASAVVGVVIIVAITPTTAPTVANS